MSKNQLIDHNATPLEDGTGLRGGTEGGSLVPPVVNDMPSTPASGSPAGGTANPTPGTPRRSPADVTDPTDALNRMADGGTRHISQAEAAREARAAADVPTRSAFNEHDPANQQREDTSDGNRASTSGKQLGERGEVSATTDDRKNLE